MRKRWPEKFTSIPLDQANYEKYFPELYQVVDQIFSENLAYQPIGFEAFKDLYGGFGRLLCPKTSRLLLDGDRVIAFSFNLPDYKPLLASGKASLADLSYDTHRQHLDRPLLVFKTYGVLPEYRRLGIHSAFIGESLRNMQGYRGVSPCLNAGGQQFL